MRIGIGQDSHRFEKNIDDTVLILGGIRIEGSPGLKANSDGDVIIHALCNAIGSAVGKGSLSTYSDDHCKQGITDSTRYLKVALGYIHEKGLKVNNVSITLEAASPHLEPHLIRMKTRLSKILGITRDDVGITVTSGEGLSDFGKGLGIQAIAVISLC